MHAKLANLFNCKTYCYTNTSWTRLLVLPNDSNATLNCARDQYICNRYILHPKQCVTLSATWLPKRLKRGPYAVIAGVREFSRIKAFENVPRVKYLDPRPTAKQCNASLHFCTSQHMNEFWQTVHCQSPCSYLSIHACGGGLRHKSWQYICCGRPLV